MLILKNEIKEVFKTLGMPEGLTVVRTGKLVSISGNCGEPVFTITKVEIGVRLTKAERTIIIEDYIIPVIKENKKAILEYIKLKKDTTVVNKLDKITNKYNLGNSAKSWRKPQEGFEYLSIIDTNCTIKYIPDENVYKVSIGNVEFEEAKKTLKKLLKVAEVILPEYEDLLLMDKERTDSLRVYKNLLNEKCGF